MTKGYAAPKKKKKTCIFYLFICHLLLILGLRRERLELEWGFFFHSLEVEPERGVSGVEGDICGKVKEEEHFWGKSKWVRTHIDNPSPGSPLLLW